MSDWQVGDLALCIKRGPWLGDVTRQAHPWPAPKAGEICLVSAVAIVSGNRVGLHFEEYPARPLPLLSTRFVKVTPPEADEFDRETIALLNAQPALVPAQPTDRQRSFEQGV